MEDAITKLTQLLTVDPALGIELEDRFRDAARELEVRSVQVPPGHWGSARRQLEQTDAGLLVVDGWVAREVVFGRRVTCDLAGPGDVLQSPVGLEDSLLSASVEWSAVTPVSLAILDDARLERWPEVQRQLRARVAARSVRLALERAIVALPAIDARILSFFSHMAAYWGTVGTEGIVIRPPLSHARLAQLVGSRRPTITSALGRLQAADTLSRRADGSWVLRPGQAPAPPAVRDRSGLAEVRPPVIALPPAGAASASRFEALAERLSTLETRRRGHLDQEADRRQQLEHLTVRVTSMRQGALDMQRAAQTMREDTARTASTRPPRADRQ
ncbi:MAG: Crp/Fnr family transcriptional regulator [Solirubrobacterales bacterium]|nr:Crp/Fnr family transcriptional regulator [Solirubrobacterales bacterium]